MTNVLQEGSSGERHSPESAFTGASALTLLLEAFKPLADRFQHLHDKFPRQLESGLQQVRTDHLRAAHSAYHEAQKTLQSLTVEPLALAAGKNGALLFLYADGHIELKFIALGISVYWEKDYWDGIFIDTRNHYRHSVSGEGTAWEKSAIVPIDDLLRDNWGGQFLTVLLGMEKDGASGATGS